MLIYHINIFNNRSPRNDPGRADLANRCAPLKKEREKEREVEVDRDREG